MKTVFTKKEMYQLKGCYNDKALEELEFMKLPKDEITLDDIFAEPQRCLRTNEKIWFIFNSCGLTLKEQQEISITIAQGLTHIFIEHASLKTEILDCLDVAERFVEGKLTVHSDELKEKNVKVRLCDMATSSRIRELTHPIRHVVKAAAYACIFMEYNKDSGARATQLMAQMTASHVTDCFSSTEESIDFLKKVLQPYV